MSQTAVLVWLSASSLLPTFRADLEAFAQARLLRLEAPHENAAAFHGSSYALDVVAQLESSLEEARNAAAALEPGRALAALDRAEHLLREHAELPQSAWLMAEILELSADIESGAPDGADAERALRQRAAALEGPRATPFSDRATPDRPLETASPIRIEINGLEPNDTLEWDGLRTTAAFATAPGEHHARVARNSRLLWAGWVRVAAGTGASTTAGAGTAAGTGAAAGAGTAAGTGVAAGAMLLRLPVPEPVACSSDDIGQGRFVAGRAVAAANARCESYVLARARSTGGFEAALCERETCGAVVISEQPRRRAVAAKGADKKRLWPYAVALSAGALAVTGVVLWRAGVFDRREPATNEAWVYNPQPTPAGFRF